MTANELQSAKAQHFSNDELDSILLQLTHLPKSPDDLLAEHGEAKLEALFEQAKIRNVAAITAEAFRKSPNVDEQLRQKALGAYATAAHNDMHLAKSAARISCACEEAGIKILVHKGPVLWRALRAPGPVKVSSDVDVLIFPQDLARANVVLRGLGYRCVIVKGREATYESEEFAQVDLHWSLLTVSTWAEELGGFMESAWERRVKVDIEGTSVLTLSPTDTVLALALHAGCHHICKQWIQIYELALCTVLWDGQIDWDYIVATAESVGLKNALYCPLRLAVSRFGGLVPDDVMRRLSLPLSKKGLEMIAAAAFSGRIKGYSSYRAARTVWNLTLQSGPGSLFAWVRSWTLHQLSKRRNVGAFNSEAALLMSDETDQ